MEVGLGLCSRGLGVLGSMGRLHGKQRGRGRRAPVSGLAPPTLQAFTPLTPPCVHPDSAQRPRPGPSSSRPTFRLTAGLPFLGRVTSKVAGCRPWAGSSHPHPAQDTAGLDLVAPLPACHRGPPAWSTRPGAPRTGAGAAEAGPRASPPHAAQEAATVSIPSVGLPHETHWEVQAGGLNRPLGYGGLGAWTCPFLVAVAERAGRSRASVSGGQVLSGQVSVKTVPKNHLEEPLPAWAGAPEVTPSLLGTGQIKRTPPRPSPPLGAWACL